MEYKVAYIHQLRRQLLSDYTRSAHLYVCQNFVSVNMGICRLSNGIGSYQVVILFQLPF